LASYHITTRHNAEDIDLIPKIIVCIMWSAAKYFDPNIVKMNEYIHKHNLCFMHY
jgi:hypothetical protein